MNDNEVIENMIRFIKDKEKDYQASKLVSTTVAKTDVVKQIVEELERVTSDENKSN